MNPILFAILCIFSSQNGHPDIPLWEGPVPMAKGDEPGDRPDIRVWLAPNAKDKSPAVLVVPGGGYGGLANDHEGKQIAEFLNARGVHAFVLKYRLGPKYNHPVPWLDASRAIRLIRSRASEWKVDSSRLGIWGFSAGGHLTSTVITQFDKGHPKATDPVEKESSRPDFAILCYPVISMEPPMTHMGSRRNLLGSNPDPELAKSLSNQNRVRADTPPCFILHTAADSVVPVGNAIVFYQACIDKKVPAELHIFQDGPHGVGLAKGDPVLKVWPELLWKWLGRHKFTP
jgi:acetyl esterase/lipase